MATRLDRPLVGNDTVFWLQRTFSDCIATWVVYSSVIGKAINNDSAQEIQMNAPNFAALAADIREQQDMEAYRRKRREKWLARPLNEREEVIRDELTNALRTDMSSEFKTEDAVDWVRDHFADADGARDLRELLNAVAEEDSGRAWDVLKRVLGVVAKVEHENEV